MPTYEIKLKGDGKGVVHKLPVVKFNRVHGIHLFLSNENGEAVAVSKVAFLGSNGDVTDMSKLEASG
jgi:hypothetical protein